MKKYLLLAVSAIVCEVSQANEISVKIGTRLTPIENKPENPNPVGDAMTQLMSDALKNTDPRIIT